MMMAALLLHAGTAAAAATFVSGPERVDLLELYTSEGCSSCPPAEAWLGDLREDRGLWRAFVPVAFHVNYWDRLGWRDRFAVPAYADRQRAYAAAWRAPTIYTPGFVRAGVEWRPGAASPAPSRGGTLTAEVEGGRVAVLFQPPGPGRYRAHVALLGGGLRSDVRRGENAGRTLRHEFLVLGLTEGVLERPPEGGHPTLTLELPVTGETPDRRSVAVWVTSVDGLVPIQATGGWLP
jgi:hypothetical protein